MRSTAPTLLKQNFLTVQRCSSLDTLTSRVIYPAHWTLAFNSGPGCLPPPLRFSRRTFQTSVTGQPGPCQNLARRYVEHLEVWFHAVYFSDSPWRHIRKTYFPKPPNSRSPKRNGFFFKVRAAINALPSGVVLWTVLGLNGVVYVLWNVGIDRAQNHRDSFTLKFLMENFTLSWQNWKEGRFWTLLTSCFSNQATSHILMNALTFYWMAPPVIHILGNVSFLTLYLGGGIASSLVTLYCNELILKKRRVVHGASGAIYAVISFMACTAPKATFLIFGVVPMPAWGCVTGLFAWDFVNAISQRETGVSEISHLSGITSGIVYFLYMTGRLPRFF